MAAERDGDGTKLVWWILGALLAIAIAALSWWGKTLEARLERLDTTYAHRWEGLAQLNNARGEKFVEIATKLSALEPRATQLEGRLSTVEPRLPLFESKLGNVDARLSRIEQKLDELLSRRQGR